MKEINKRSAKILVGANWSNSDGKEYVCFHLWDCANAVVIDFQRAEIIFHQGKGYQRHGVGFLETRISFERIIRYDIHSAHIGHSCIVEKNPSNADKLENKMFVALSFGIYVHEPPPLFVRRYDIGTVPSPLLLDRMEENQPKTSNDIVCLMNQLIVLAEDLNKRLE